jgi:hypothetical protein
MDTFKKISIAILNSLLVSTSTYHCYEATVEEAANSREKFFKKLKARRLKKKGFQDLSENGNI